MAHVRSMVPMIRLDCGGYANLRIDDPHDIVTDDLWLHLKAGLRVAVKLLQTPGAPRTFRHVHAHHDVPFVPAPTTWTVHGVLNGTEQDAIDLIDAILTGVALTRT